MRRSWIVALLLVLATAGLAAPALAHITERAASPGVIVPPAEVDSMPTAPTGVEPIVAAGRPSPAVLDFQFLILVLAASLIPVFRFRRAAVGLLVAVLVVFAFESGTHSVHHLGEADAQCAVSGVASHLGATVADPVVLATPADPGDVVPPAGRERRPQRFARPDQGRAPPVLA